jgi:hypothetical protein
VVKKQIRPDRDPLTVERLADAKEFKTLVALATTPDPATFTFATNGLSGESDNLLADVSGWIDSMPAYLIPNP